MHPLCSFFLFRKYNLKKKKDGKTVCGSFKTDFTPPKKRKKNLSFCFSDVQLAGPQTQIFEKPPEKKESDRKK